MIEYFNWDSFGEDIPEQVEGERILNELNEIANNLDHKPDVGDLNEIWEDYFNYFGGESKKERTMTIKEIWCKAFDLYVEDDEKIGGHGKAWEFFCDCVATGEITMNDVNCLYDDMREDRKIMNQYGLESKTFKEELALPEAVRRTRNNKVALVTKCEQIIMMATQIQHDAKLFPELNDEKHSQLVQEYTNKINEALLDLEAAEELRWTRG